MKKHDKEFIKYGVQAAKEYCEPLLQEKKWEDLIKDTHFIAELENKIIYAMFHNKLTKKLSAKSWIEPTHDVMDTIVKEATGYDFSFYDYYDKFFKAKFATKRKDADDADDVEE